MTDLEQKVVDYYGETALPYLPDIAQGKYSRYTLSDELECSVWTARKILNIVKSHKKKKPEIRGVTPEEKIDVEDVYRRSKRAFENKRELIQRKQNQSITFGEQEICICFGGDEHIGNKGTDIERMFDEAQIIAETPNMYAWKMGDLVDNFIIGYLIAKNEQAPIEVKEQWALAKEYLQMHGNSIIAAVGGNHDAWTQLTAFIDHNRDIMPKGILYDPDEIKADVKVGDASFPVWARHKWRGNSIYNATHGQERAARFDNPDFTIYAGAHVHKGCFFREFNLKQERKAAVLSGTYKLYDDYQRKKGFKQSDKSTVCPVIFRPDGTFDKIGLDHAQRYFNNLN